MISNGATLLYWRTPRKKWLKESWESCNYNPSERKMLLLLVRKETVDRRDEDRGQVYRTTGRRDKCRYAGWSQRLIEMRLAGFNTSNLYTITASEAFLDTRRECLDLGSPPVGIVVPKSYQQLHKHRVEFWRRDIPSHNRVAEP